MTNEEQKEKSEFGKGFSYCLGLFLAHAERETYDPVSWFYGASDHILEIVVPDCMKHAHLFVDRVIYLSHIMDDGYIPTESDRKWAIQKAKDLLLEWDIKCGIDAVQGEYE